MYIVLMAGGAGTRFWPRSRQNMPKQLLKIFGDRTMLQETYDRIKDVTENEKILIITGENLKDEIKDQLPQIPERNIIAEPFGKNTAPCVALAATIINKRENKENVAMAVLPADHLVNDVDGFKSILKTAEKYALESGTLITLGIKPSYPETGYGYIQRNSKLIELDGHKIYPVKTFAEKPNLDTANRFLESGDFYWNAGIFIWSTYSILSEFEQQMPELNEGLPELYEKVDTMEMDEGILKVYSAVKSISIDYAIMEGAKNVSVIESDFDWNDVGSWEAVYNLSAKNENKNAVYTEDSIEVNAKNNLFYSENKKLIAAIDIDDIVMVETKDAILICKKDSSQRVKDVVDRLRHKEKDQYL
ncbi:MAG: mannose-1-phosphate guanylyltransferase [Calditrichaeota bacterium]|nr:MAG: mannose-1-phosphate guanylyltransferase [Calditrichota bacterium]MBL1207557.1 mannose-1-phosphate guanylyltransferase [Calditrichota bacterium]NOG47389.1 NTP transferase domain-containing protein [Calditrichota bacterium]